MTDKELRGEILRYFYGKRREGKITPKPQDFDNQISQRDIDSICKQLDEHKLIWYGGAYEEVQFGNLSKPFTEPKLLYHYGWITARGVDVIENNDDPPIAINLQNVTISNSAGVQIGTGNIQYLNLFNKLIEEIENSSASPEDKAVAKSKLRALLEHPLVSAITGAVIGKILGL